MSRHDHLILDSSKEHKGFWTGLILIFVMLGCLILALSMYNSSIGMKLQLETEKVSIMGLDKGYEGFTVLHISDLRGEDFGSDAAGWKELLNKKNWNCVLLTGDMVGEGANAEPFLSLIHVLQTLNPKAPVYFIEGDRDPQAVNSQPHGSAEVLADWILSAQRLGAIYLDAPQCVSVGKKNVWISPLSLYGLDVDGMLKTLTQKKEEMEVQGKQYENEGGAIYRAVCYRIDAMRRSEEQFAQIRKTDLQIAVNHMPVDKEYVRTQLEWADEKQNFQFRAIDLLTCGHYCGGDWCLPGSTLLYVKERGFFPSREGIVGMERINSLNQYISPGLSYSGETVFKSRMLNRPTVTLLQFTSSIQ